MPRIVPSITLNYPATHRQECGTTPVYPVTPDPRADVLLPMTTSAYPETLDFQRRLFGLKAQGSTVRHRPTRLPGDSASPARDDARGGRRDTSPPHHLTTSSLLSPVSPASSPRTEAALHSYKTGEGGASKNTLPLINRTGAGLRLVPRSNKAT